MSEGPIKDRYNLSENPQYILKIKPNSGSKNNKFTTWLLLTRHITDKLDFAENKEYIALVVYKNNGKRVYYPSNLKILIFLSTFITNFEKLLNKKFLSCLKIFGIF